MDERLVQFDEKMQKTMNNLSEEFGSLVRSRRKKFHFRIRWCMWRTSAKHTEISASATFWKRRRARGK